MYTKHCVANRFAPNGFENLARLEVKTADFDQSEKWILSILSLLCDRFFFLPRKPCLPGVQLITETNPEC